MKFGVLKASFRFDFKW